MEGKKEEKEKKEKGEREGIDKRSGDRKVKERERKESKQETKCFEGLNPEILKKKPRRTDAFQAERIQSQCANSEFAFQ